MTDLAQYIDDLNEDYLRLHRAKEDAFWQTRMGLADRHGDLTEADLALREFLGDAGRLAQLRELRDGGSPTPGQGVVLDGWILMFERNQVEDGEARRIQREVVGLESAIQRSRGRMDLGYRDAKGELVRKSSVFLGSALRTDPDPTIRRACFEGLRSIETHVLGEGWTEIVKLRNRFARRLGHEDYYEYKVRWAEGFDKKTLFGFLDDLEARTRDKAAREIAALRERRGPDAVEPWNFAFNTWGGALQEKRDPWFRFEGALETWARTFAALGVRYRGALVTLDLLDRKGKYENGFMHGPVPAFRRRGEWQPAEINFTANALPGRVGAGYRASQTLFHEGGHAAHYSNITMDAPCFSQEMAPTSVALSETQSMFFDHLLGDADWRARHARDDGGAPMPQALTEEEIASTQPFSAQAVRNLLCVCYVEKAVYEMADDELTPDNVLRTIREVERRIVQLDGGCPRPTLAVPHLLSGEASAYYHGYVLAQMAVAQTREHFFGKYGRIVDEPRIGEDLARDYWAPGNSRGFLDYVRGMTGRPFSADALVADVSRSTEQAIADARARLDALADAPEPPESVDLDLRLRVIHGKETVVEETTDVLAAAAKFREWLSAEAIA